MEFSCQKFGLDILQVLCSDTFDKNIIYSPLSIYMALGMTLFGAKGSTLIEMSKTLHWDIENSDRSHQQLSDCIKSTNVDNGENGVIKIANKLFLEKTFELLDSYVKAISELYSGGVDKMDFGGSAEKSRAEINGWVEAQTNGKITNLLAPGSIHGLTKLILVNAIYFKASWQDKFSVIGDQNFYLLNGTAKPTKMMSKASDYKHLKNTEFAFSAVQIPFKRIQNIEYSLMIILPDDKSSLPTLEKAIFQKEWKSVLGDDLFEYSSVRITMPKFRVESSFGLKEQLKSLGIKDAFSQDADFSLMTGSRDLMIDDVVHKAFIDIDENGVEAAAATAVMMMTRCAPRIPRNPIEFTCDHSFMFALVKQGSLPLFVGHFTQC